MSRPTEPPDLRPPELIAAAAAVAATVESPGAAGPAEDAVRALSSADECGRSDLVSPLNTSGVRAREQVILVVDDEADNRDLVRAYLTRHGFRTISADSGGAALSYLASQRVDLVLLDVVMPDLSGGDVLSQIRKTRSASELPVIMTTALAGSADIVTALSQGANDYVTKPLDFMVVVARIAAQLRLKGTHEQLQSLHLGFERARALVTEVLRRTPEWDTASLAQLGRCIGEELGRCVPAVRCTAFSVDRRVGVSDAVATLQSGSISVPTPTAVQIAALEQTAAPLIGESVALFPVVGAGGRLVLIVGLETAQLAPKETSLRLLGSFVQQVSQLLELHHAPGRRREVLSSAAIGHRELAASAPCASCRAEGTAACPVHGTMLQSPPGHTPTVLADRYRLCRQVGQGGMGTVYKAVDERLQRHVAIKVLHPQGASSRHLRERFNEEARLVAQLNNPGIVKVHDYGEADLGLKFIAMEWLDGLDLAAVLRQQGAGTARQVLALLKQAASALDHAHQAGVVHRDIKPANLFLSPGRAGLQLKLLDFGVARDMGRGNALTSPGCVVGTPQYMAPEQLLSSAVGPRSDLYSLAAVAYEALTGVPPRAMDASILQSIRTTPRGLSAHLPHVPASVERRFMVALEPDPALRPRSAGAWLQGFARDLAKVTTGGIWDEDAWTSDRLP